MQLIQQSACELLARGQTFVLATVVAHKGATPRTAGSKMIVTADGRGTGTIGGGLLEAEVMAAAGRLIGQGRSALMHFDLSSDVVAATDMICGGSVDVLLACVTPTADNRQLFDRWQQAAARRRPGCLVTVAVPGEGRHYSAAHCLIEPGDRVTGTLPLVPEARERVLSTAREATRLETLQLDKTLVVVEPMLPAAAAYLFGAGHVALPTARLAAMVGFEVWVFDDRPEFVDPRRFPDAHQLHVLESFERAFADRTVTADSFVVIFTRGHLHDKIVLAQALATEAGYIGMIGSRHKRDAIYQALVDEGVPQAQIDRVHCPIGVAIGAETPEEIAVSIVAEMIAVRSRKTP